MRFCHLSDPHLGPLPPVQVRQLLNKRVFGYLNWLKNRRKSLSSDVLAQLEEDLKARKPDHLVVTGDLVNLALPGEYETARNWLASLGAGADVTVVPGNHDAYVAGGLENALARWAAFMVSDEGWRTSDDIFPLVRVRARVAFIGLSTAIPTAPIMATGQVGARQLAKLAIVLDQTAEQGLCRVILIHHPPQSDACKSYKRLIDGAALCGLIREKGCELILHGHTHLPTQTFLPGPRGEIPVIGVAAASQAPSSPAGKPSRHKKPPARYNLFDVTPPTAERPTTWHLTWRSRGFAEDCRLVDFDQKTFTIAQASRTSS